MYLIYAPMVRAIDWLDPVLHYMVLFYRTQIVGDLNVFRLARSRKCPGAFSPFPNIIDDMNAVMSASRLE